MNYMNTKWIIAGNHAEYQQYISHMKQPHLYRYNYVSDSYRLRGLSDISELFIGTWYNHHDIENIMRELQIMKSKRGNMKNRFSLEQEIMECWSVTKDIDVLFEAVMEKDLTKDQICNILLGMKELYDLRFDKLFQTFEFLVSKREI